MRGVAHGGLNYGRRGRGGCVRMGTGWGNGKKKNKRMMGWKLIHSRMATREHFFYRDPKQKMVPHAACSKCRRS